MSSHPLIGQRARLASVLGLLAIIGAPGGPAFADRADQNATTAAEDAFGTTVGSQTIGLYSQIDARGFNPQQAGNLRIEGLYFDQETWIAGDCMVRDSSMRVGIAAQSYSFPSPTGIADLKLHTPGDKPSLSGVFVRGAYQETNVLVEGERPVSDSLSVGACVMATENYLGDTATRTSGVLTGATTRWHPAAGTEVVMFYAHLGGAEHALLPQVYTDAFAPLPLWDQRRLASLPFTRQDFRQANYGAILHQILPGDWRVQAGVFRSQESDPPSSADEYLSIQPDRSADHVLDTVPKFSAASTSGEIRIARAFIDGVHEHSLEFAVRGRRIDRNFGGDSIVDFGPVTLDSPPSTASPPIVTTAPSIDETRQLDGGVMLKERWTGVGSFGVGLLRSHYRRTVLAPAALPETSSVSPWLANAQFTALAGSTLTFYGSFVQGLEDSALAPSSAANRGEPPPATRTRQVDGGLRFAPRDGVSLVLGAFDIHKIYFNLGENNIYRALGTINHRGFESSLTFSDSDAGLTVVAGGVWIRPRVARTAIEPGATSDVPIGPVPLVLTGNIDYAPSRWQPIAASLQWNWYSSRVGTTDDRYKLPPLTTVGAGLRYEAKLRGHPLTVRFDALNLTNAKGLHISTVGLVVPELGRRASINVTADL